ncbi:hypothetical protein PCASD_14807 [Puccinia coronata f. sp. avenae]|uniref:Uncharacterized protein n=1 Tax=Puccinia coronata f. sp. avenae TaxID=200324 RepID=A0A2N5TBW0_9BASI|nr:hypothetical protein PCASD_14807 [Puccinia coronata f. sp. avenae]
MAERTIDFFCSMIEPVTGFYKLVGQASSLTNPMAWPSSCKNLIVPVEPVAHPPGGAGCGVGCLLSAKKSPGTWVPVQVPAKSDPTPDQGRGFLGGYIHSGYVRVIPVVDIPDIQLHPPTTMPSSNRTSKRSRKQGASSSQPPHQSKKESETAPQSEKDQPKDVSQDQEEEDDSGAA